MSTHRPALLAFFAREFLLLFLLSDLYRTLRWISFPFLPLLLPQLLLFSQAGGELAAGALDVLSLALADGGGNVFAEEDLLKCLNPGRV